MVSERMRRKLSEVNSAAQAQLSPVQDHINFTLQVLLLCKYWGGLMYLFHAAVGSFWDFSLGFLYLFLWVWIGLLFNFLEIRKVQRFFVLFWWLFVVALYSTVPNLASGCFIIIIIICGDFLFIFWNKKMKTFQTFYCFMGLFFRSDEETIRELCFFIIVISWGWFDCLKW